jgi:hypothetical protein
MRMKGDAPSPFAIARSRTLVVKPEGSLSDVRALARLKSTVLIDNEKRAS